MLTQFAIDHELPKFRLDQFNQAYYQQLIVDFDSLTTWPINLRQSLQQQVPFIDLELVQCVESSDGQTEKAIFRLPNEKLIETVLMKHDDGRNTVCVSCMRGCPVNCDFCATGKLGFGGNVTARQIVDQVLFFARKLQTRQQAVSNIVFMGMGEPMLNLPEVLKAIHILTDPAKFGIGKRRITLSTSGYVPHFKKCIESGFRGRVAISLHAPNQKLREQLMPVAKIFPLTELFETLDSYTQLTNKRISYEYILISNVNDKTVHAHQLGKLLKDRLAHVNLIPYNPISDRDYKRSTPKQIHRFAHILSHYNVPFSIRITMGDDINAACGQLAANIDQQLKNGAIE